MAGITLESAQAQLDAWLAASMAVAQSQSYEIDTGTSRRKLTRADAAEIRDWVSYWNAEVRRLSRVRGGTRYVVPE